MPRDLQKMAFGVLILSEGFGLKRMYFQSQNLKTDLSKKILLNLSDKNEAMHFEF